MLEARVEVNARRGIPIGIGSNVRLYAIDAKLGVRR